MVQFRRTATTVLVLAVAALGALPPSAAAAVPAPRVTVTSVDAVVGDDRAVRVGLRCKRAACAGRVTLKVPGVGTLKRTYRLGKGGATVVSLRLTPAQLRTVQRARRAGTVTVSARGGRTVRHSVVLRKAEPALTVTSPTLTVGHDHVATVALACATGAACVAEVSLVVDEASGGGSQVVRLASGRSGTARFALTDAQTTTLMEEAGSVAGLVRVAETSPERLVERHPVTVLMDHGGGHGDHQTPVPTGDSSAFARGWNPTEYDTCTRADHESYAVIGVDGKLYPSWHPPVHTRADGSTCTFGHEHGDDPRNSDLYEWVLSEYRTQNPDANGVPFGHGSEQLDVYGKATGATVHRHEDDPGHKVVVANDQQMGVTFTDRWGDTHALVCDTLIKAHQGSHSSDATKNNTHELVYATRCNDGTKVLTTLMSNYGNANELHSSCSRPFALGHGPATAVRTVGSILPKGEGGSRLIPTLDCIESHVKAGTESGIDSQDDRRGSPASADNPWWWAGYEQWQSYNSIRTADGHEVARFEPWFGVQNPSRYYTGNGPTDTTVGYLNDLAWEPGAHQSWGPWRQQRSASATRIDRRSPQAWFNGAIRDAWLTTTKVDNRAAASEVIHTDPWGRQGGADPFPGSIRTVVSRTSNVAHVTTTTPSALGRRFKQYEALTREGASAPLTLQFFYDYGRDESGRPLGVHAPN